MSFLSKNDAVSKLTTAITNPSDPQLQPTSTVPIKSGNLQGYIQNLLDWIFPPNLTSIDLRGRVLGVKRVPNTPIYDYSNLDFLTVMPLGGIIMYPANGINVNIGGGVYKATLTPSTTVVDGFLFMDGSTIDVSISGNSQYIELKSFLDGKFGNTNANTLLILPNMKGSTPIGYDPATTTTPAFNNPNIAGSENIVNYAQVGNVGGGASAPLTSSQMPIHSHTVNLNTGVDTHTHPIPAAQTATFVGSSPTFDRNVASWAGLPGAFGYGGINTISYSHIHNVSGNTGNAGNSNKHENRMQYMVLNYMIKY